MKIDKITDSELSMDPQMKFLDSDEQLQLSLAGIVKKISHDTRTDAFLYAEDTLQKILKPELDSYLKKIIDKNIATFLDKFEISPVETKTETNVETNIKASKQSVTDKEIIRICCKLCRLQPWPSLEFGFKELMKLYPELKKCLHNLTEEDYKQLVKDEMNDTFETQLVETQSVYNKNIVISKIDIDEEVKYLCLTLLKYVGKDSSEERKNLFDFLGISDYYKEFPDVLTCPNK